MTHLVTLGRMQGEEALARDQQNAQMLVWGTQLGWMESKHFQPGTDGAAFLRTLAKVYSTAARKYTLYGEMLRPALVCHSVLAAQPSCPPGGLRCRIQIQTGGAYAFATLLSADPASRDVALPRGQRG